MRTGHLFAGIDGIGLGLEPRGFVSAWFSEYEAAPSRVLAHHYPDVPNHGDITAIDWTQVEPVDVLTGGFPCQDLSYAGKGAGIKEGTRSGLWFEFSRAIRALRPRIVLVENVPALTTRGLDIVIRDLAQRGYGTLWTSLRASDVGAAHRRERLFIVAVDVDSDYWRWDRWWPTDTDAPWTAGEGWKRWAKRTGQIAADGTFNGRTEGWPRSGERPRRAGLSTCDSEAVADGDRRRLAECCEQNGWSDGPDLEASRRGDAGRRSETPTDWGEFEPAIRRWERTIGRPAPAPTLDGRLSADFTEWHMGFPEGWTSMLSRNERLKALGNAVVPQCAEVVGRWALELVGREVAA